MSMTVEQIEKLLAEDKSPSQVAFYLGEKVTDVEAYINKYKLRVTNKQDNVKTFSDIISLKDENMDAWQKERDRIENALVRYNSFSVICDLHVPYQNPKLLEAMVKEDTNKVLFIIGDFFHFDGISSFKKTRYTAFSIELQGVMSILKLLRKKYEKIVILMANHERRYMRGLYDKMSAEYADTLKQQAILSKRITAVFDENVLETNGFWLRVGGVIMCHPDWYTKAPSKTVQNSHEYFVSLGVNNYDAILNAHTHKCTKIMKLNKTMIEMPCACVPQEYMNDGHRYNSEYYQGWTTFKVDKNRRTDFNNINVRYFNDK